MVSQVPERSHHILKLVGYILSNAAQYAVSLHYHKSTLLPRVQFVISQDPHSQYVFTQLASPQAEPQDP